MLIDLKGMVWIGTTTGLDLYDPALNVITSYSSGVNINNLSNEDVRSIYEDQAGTIWIGTYKGLNKVDRNPGRFAHFQNEPDDRTACLIILYTLYLKMKTTLYGLDIWRCQHLRPGR